MLIAATAVLAAFGASTRSAEAQDVSLVGDWRSCRSGDDCVRFAFMPNGKVIKQYLLMGGTVTGYGRYRRTGNGLQIVWTRISPRRICGSHMDENGHSHKQCQRPVENNADGPLEFNGLNTLVWRISGGPELRLERRED